MRTVYALFTVAALFTASLLSIFRGPEDFLHPRYCLLIAFTAAVLLVIFSWRTAFRQSGAWFALLIFGQGLSLQLIDAGRFTHYQHYRVIQGISGTYDVTLVILLGLLTSAVILGLRHRMTAVTDWIRTYLGLPRFMVLAGAVVVLGAFPSREVQYYGLELLLSAWITITLLACLVLGLMSAPPSAMAIWDERISRFMNGSGRQKKGIDRLAIGCAVWVTGIAVLLAIFSYERHPHIPDEFAYIYNANYFSEGRIDTPAPPVPEAFEVFLLDCNSERCIVPVPPGWPAVLAIGALVNSQWLVNPVLAGINVLLLFILLRLLYDRYTARLGILLLSASPWYLLMAMSFMTHIFSLTCALVAALSVTQMYRHRNALWGIPGGIAIGALALTRPLEGLMVASTLGLITLFIPGRRFRLAPTATLASTSMVVGAIILPYNQVLTGDPFRFPIMAYADRVLGHGANALGFGPDKGVEWGGLDPFPGHGFADVVVNAVLNLDAMNLEMFGWGIGSLLPVIIMLVFRKSGRLKQVDRWMLFFIAVIFGFQSLYWFSGGPDFGARYYFLAVIPLVALTTQAIRHLGQSLDSAAAPDFHGQAIILVGILVLGISSLTNFVPWRAIDKYHHYRNMRPDIRELLATIDVGFALLLVSGKQQPDLNSAMTYTSTNPYSTEPIIAWDRDPSVRQRLLQAYPERQIWLVDGPSLTGAGYRVTAGPLSAAELMR